jgi:hypothetical protein
LAEDVGALIPVPGRLDMHLSVRVVRETHKPARIPIGKFHETCFAVLLRMPKVSVDGSCYRR